MLSLQVSTLTVAAKPSSSSHTDTLKVQNTVDKLNGIAYDIYLEAPDSARKLAEKALILAKSANYQAGIGQSFLNIGHVYWSQSYYPIALFYVNKALTELPRNKPLMISLAYNTLGRIYAELGKYNLALANIGRSEKFAGTDPVSLAAVYGERSLVYKRLKKYDQAIPEAKKALKLSQSVGDDADAAIFYGRLSGIYTLLGQYKKSLAYSDTALCMSVQIRNNRLRSTTYIEYAGIYLRLHDYDKAIFYAKRGGDLADSIGVVDAITDAYKVLINSYERKGDMKLVMDYQRRYNKMQDSLNNFNKNRSTELIQDYFALDKRLDDMTTAQEKTAEIKAKVKAQRGIIISLSLSLMVVIIVLSVTYYFYKHKKLLSERLNLQNEALVKHKQLIEAQTANLETLSKIKDKLLAVIAHDLRTPLANLRNIADMFDSEYLSAEEVQWLMKDINTMVKSAELTLSNLLEWAGSQIKGRSVNSSQLDIFLLGVEMEQTFSHALLKKNIEFANQASPGRSVLADENHVKVVLRNLISNAIKFTDENGRVTLNTVYEEKEAVISVEDNGKGMTEEEKTKLFSIQTHFSQRGTSGEAGMGIGLLLCKELVELNGGRLWIDSAPGQGSTFYFSLPLNREYVQS
ncbi:MAG TPA: ATP-binding protein [Mucilaginibacter sp.]|nr:ATP-binding protein [Mucilaginibacter sp.]